MANDGITKTFSTLFPNGMSVSELDRTDLNVSEATTALTELGLSEERATKIIEHEIFSISYYGKQRSSSIAPHLLDLFGEEYVTDALLYADSYMAEFNIEWSQYQVILERLLQLYRKEQLIAYPNIIEAMLTELKYNKNLISWNNLDSVSMDALKTVTGWSNYKTETFEEE